MARSQWLRRVAFLLTVTIADTNVVKNFAYPLRVIAGAAGIVHRWYWRALTFSFGRPSSGVPPAWFYQVHLNGGIQVLGINRQS